nr:RecName: Full=14 kDa cell wall protein [Nicotiana tabacum]
AVFVILTNVYT